MPDHFLKLKLDTCNSIHTWLVFSAVGGPGPPPAVLDLPHTPGAPAFVATAQKVHSLLNLPALLSMGLEFLIPHNNGSIS